MDKKVELLAPAGNYEAFMGAINAGADAVYLGGEKFGATAYADNFTTQEICRALHTAHFMGRKIYLTVNTLFKEQEVSVLYDYLLPFYEAGLDGVIVQDLGVLQAVRPFYRSLGRCGLCRPGNYPFRRFVRSKRRRARKWNVLFTGPCVTVILVNAFSAVC